MKTKIFYLAFLLFALFSFTSSRSQDLVIEGDYIVEPGQTKTYRIAWPYGQQAPSDRFFNISVVGGTLVHSSTWDLEFTVQWGVDPMVGGIGVEEWIHSLPGGLTVYIGLMNPGVIYTPYPFFSDVYRKPLIHQLEADGGFCDNNFQYTWQHSTDSINWIDVGTGAEYPETGPEPDPAKPLYVRRRVDCDVLTMYSEPVLIRYRSSQTENKNYVRTTEVWYPGIQNLHEVHKLTSGQKKQTTIYYDGLGRQEQTLWKEGSPSKKDLVTPVTYDAFGRESKKYLAYEANNGDGFFKLNAIADQALYMGDPVSGKYKNESHFYAESVFENSPLNRLHKSLAPGASWAGNNKGIKTEYTLNGNEHAVRIWNIAAIDMTAVPVSGGVYDPLKLNITTITDENGNRIVEFRNIQDQLILKKQQNKPDGAALTDAHSGWLCTYYVHDDFGRMRFVITPKAVELMDESNNWVIDAPMANGLCYKYSYDTDSRIIEKKLPDAEPVYMVYDQRSRLIMTQDGNQRAGLNNTSGQKEWSYTVFNDHNEEVASGVAITGTVYSRAAVQQAFDQRVMLGNISLTIATNTSETIIAHNPAPVFGGSTAAGLSFTSLQVHEVIYYGTPTNTQFVAEQLGYANGFENIETLVPSKRTIGLQTAVKVRVFDATANKYITTTSIYNQKGKVIQSQSANYLGNATVTTTQYDFQGNTRSTLFKESGPEAKTILTKFEIDHTGRSTAIVRNITEIKDGQSISTGEKRFIENEYDGLGEIASRTYAPGYNGPHGNYLEKLVYDHNIRGWITGINKAFLSGTSAAFFGMELGYNLPGNVSFANSALNGNVAGVAWKSAGDMVARRFDYFYDHANRLKSANFSQQNESTFSSWTNDKFDFSVHAINYDANGNITRMEQQGVTIAGIVAMDRMTYGYEAKSNKLTWVTEDAPASDHKLYDFTDKKNQGSGNIDYTYDANGNIISDKNKGIISIRYNRQNLPEKVEFDGGRGSIEYIYDAAGVKQQKKVTDKTSGSDIIKTTTYSGPVTYNQNIAFYTFEESRVRLAKNTVPGQPPAFAVDYFIRDHLNSVRMVLTEELVVDQYPAATIELATQVQEEQFYTIPNRTDKPVELQNVAGATERYGQKMTRLSALQGGHKVGPSILLKTMAGDRLAAKTDYYYKENGLQNNVNTLVNDIATSLLSHILAGQGGEVAKAQAATIHTNVMADDVVLDLISNNNSGYVSNKPKAYLNYIVFDEQFKAIGQGLIQVQNNGALQAPLVLPNIEIEKNGYVYIFANNESEQAVYFDNLQVTHNHGHILEETHYYPFGLAMKAISSKALNTNPKNKNGYNGKLLESEEFGDGSGLEQYDFGARYYDAQTGRWHVIDPHAEDFINASPYAYAANNPMLYIDKDGKLAHLIIKYGINVGINIAMQMLTAYMFDPSVKTWGDAWDKVSMWDALWESGKDMIGSKSLRLIGDAVVGMFNYIDEVGFSNVTTAGLSKAGFTNIALSRVMPHIQKYGFKAVKHGLKKIGVDIARISRLLMPATKKVQAVPGANTTGFKPLTKQNFRENLAHYTGINPADFDAHHVFPQSMESQFRALGINVHHPSLMQWWSKETHQLFAHEYNNAWADFLSVTRTTQETLDFGRKIMSDYGLTTFF